MDSIRFRLRRVLKELTIRWTLVDMTSSRPLWLVCSYDLREGDGSRNLINHLLVVSIKFG